MNFYTDRKFHVLLALFVLLAAGVLVYGTPLSGVILISAVIIFGSLSLMWKEPHIKLAALVLLVLLSLTNVFGNQMRFGIDFVGGTRIPVTLDHSVDSVTMDEFVQTIKGRISVLGLSEVKVRAIGDNQVYVELPSNDEATIASIERSLSQQGVYEGIVDGKVAVSGDRIFRTTIRAMGSSELASMSSGSLPDWGVAFSVDRAGAEQFANAAKGKANYPIYMFLDRPTDAAIFFERESLRKAIPADSSDKEAIRAMQNAFKMTGGNTIEAYVLENLSDNVTAPTNKTQALVSQNASASYKDLLKQRGFTVVEISEAKMTPAMHRDIGGVLILERLEAAGLLTAPSLSGSLATGIPNYNYVITGSVGNDSTSSAARAVEATEKVKGIESILKGGALPVQISLGSRTTVPASLGSEFLKLSMITIASSLVVISIIIGLRYRNLRATLPIVLISFAEFTILMSILGSFTIDLAAMAGIIAAIGVGVDAQIVITDELLKKDKHTQQEKMALAFGIIKTNIVVAIFSMVPLLFSRMLSGLLLVEVIGFATSTILGAILGYLLTRPAYAAIVEMVLEGEKAAPAPAVSP